MNANETIDVLSAITAYDQRTIGKTDVAVQTLGVGQQIVVDARVPALLVAAGLLMVRAPFLVVVVAAAVVAALLRLWGLAA